MTNPSSAPEATPVAVGVAELQQALAQLFAPWVAELNLKVQAASPGEVRLTLPVAPLHVHSGGVLCGQSLMAAADTAMVLAVMTQIGGFKPMSTVQLNTSFLRAVPANSNSVNLVARVLRRGRNLVFGEVHLYTADGALAVQVTTTYALL